MEYLSSGLTIESLWKAALLIIAFILQPVFLLVVPLLAGWLAVRPTFLRSALPKGAKELGLACVSAPRFVTFISAEPWRAIRKLLLLPNPTSASVLLSGTLEGGEFLYTQFRTKLPLSRYSIFLIPVASEIRFPSFGFIRGSVSVRYRFGGRTHRVHGKTIADVLSLVPAPVFSIAPDALIRASDIFVDISSRYLGVRVEPTLFPDGRPAISIVVDEHIFGERPIGAASSTEWKHFLWMHQQVAAGVNILASGVVATEEHEVPHLSTTSVHPIGMRTMAGDMGSHAESSHPV